LYNSLLRGNYVKKLFANSKSWFITDGWGFLALAAIWLVSGVAAVVPFIGPSAIGYLIYDQHPPRSWPIGTRSSFVSAAAIGTGVMSYQFFGHSRLMVLIQVTVLLTVYLLSWGMGRLFGSKLERA
jgi:hypothetical protein